MTANDEREFMTFVRSDRKVGGFTYAIPSTTIPFLDELPDQDEPFWFAICLWDQDHSPPPVLSYVEQQNYYVVEKIESEIIEFNRCGVDRGCLARGRIWAEMNGWHHSDPTKVVKKSQEFSKWFERLSNWIKRRSTRNAVGDYLLPGAMDFASKAENMK
jgi:hypothetical protein